MAQGLPAAGCENYGGPLATAGSFVVIAATVCERRLRAFDSRARDLLWSTELPFSGNATLTTNMSGGGQFVVIANCGSRNPKGPQGSAYVAFALPRTAAKPPSAQPTR